VFNFSSVPKSFLRRIGPISILLIFFLFVWGVGYYFSYVNRPVASVSIAQQDGVVVEIPKGSSVKAIAEILGRNNVIKNDFRFLILAKISGYSTRLQAGEFLMPLGKTPREILEFLATAKPVTYSITIPEGLTAAQIAAIFAEGKWCDEQTFLSLVHDKEQITRFGLTSGNSLEGYLFPDTYIFTKEMYGAEKIMALMLERFKTVWAQESAGVDPPPDVDQTVIMASIVEKETADPAERNLIAGVFINRLAQGMKLQSDPTVVYGATDYDGVITKTHLTTPTEYNTYVIAGLPVGPICNPGREAIAAVLHPEESSNLYFVSKNDGTHQFSTNLADHNRAVQKYQRKKKVIKGK
jgi:UPF0755 protein